MATEACLGQSKVIEIPAQTPIAVYLNRHVPMKVGQPIRAALVYPVFEGETEVLPARSVLEGTIVALKPDNSRRLHSRLRGDFTPYRVPVVQFSWVVLADGRSVPIPAAEVAAGAPIVRITPPPPKKGGVFTRAAETAKQALRNQVRVFTAPDKGDRFMQAIYSSLPYHPQRVETATAWNFETAQPFHLPDGAAPLTLPDPNAQDAKSRDLAANGKKDPAAKDPSIWMIEANLTESLDSATTPVGKAIHAVVARPVFNEDKSVAVPVGSILTGTVVRARPARKFGRGGTLRFAFTELTLPESQPQRVQTTLAGVDSQSAQSLALDSEGQVKPENKSVVVPLILAALATRTLHRDADGGSQAGRNATGANGFGLIGVVIGAAAGSSGFAAGIGYYGGALTVYDRYLTHGKEAVFAKNTRIVVQTSARRSAVLKADSPGASR